MNFLESKVGFGAPEANFDLGMDGIVYEWSICSFQKTEEQFLGISRGQTVFQTYSFSKEVASPERQS